MSERGTSGGSGGLAVGELMYELAPGALATTAAEPRDAARMLVVWRSDPGRIEDRAVRDLPGLLPAGMVMVRNVSRVLAARLAGVRRDTGGRAEGLYLSGTHDGGSRRWRMYLRMKRPRAGAVVDVCLEGDGCVASGVWLELLRPDPSEPGVWDVAVHGVAGDSAVAAGVGDVGGEAGGGGEGCVSDAAVLERVGRAPLPPYILSARARGGPGDAGVEGAGDRARYQAVYAGSEAGSVAAPTAGLHMTPGLIEELVGRGVAMADVVLHVGAGTFKPVTASYMEDHAMHAEWCRVPAATRRLVAEARAGVLAVGTTSVRALESFPGLLGGDLGADLEGRTRLLITPGHRFRHVDALLTNFHLPGSTLMALVAALLAQGGEPASRSASRLVGLYQGAMARGYRFYSYGDAMLILP